MNRLMEAVRNNLSNTARIGLTEHIRRDIYWWVRFLPKYNGVNTIVEAVWTEPDTVISTDTCLSGCGGVSRSEFF